MTPLARFLVLGALLFAAERATDGGRALGLGRDPIHVSAAAVEALQRNWTAETGRAPGAAELRAAVQRDADEEMLVREALRLQLDRSDPVARTRLVQNLRFVHGDGEEAALLAEAGALNMASHDLVVRRRLVQAMEQRLAAQVRVSASEVSDYLAQHPERYAAPARIAFRQVYFGSDAHGADLERVARDNEPRRRGATAGDPFLLGADFPLQSQAELARTFGPGFARDAMALPLQAWSGPLRSAYGLHYLYVTDRRDPAPLEGEAVRRQAHYALLEEREQQATREQLVALRRHYPLEAEGPRWMLGFADAQPSLCAGAQPARASQ